MIISLQYVVQRNWERIHECRQDIEHTMDRARGRNRSEITEKILVLNASYSIFLP